eukprot:CAMPEP_0203750420 /NCGR_PEP_ID=MMETSP0098-20131031/4650_1 /ASSEMBLY_ACC=CAM_ASM_000208 /TAXON_ID=96639 /ORGANISM=" , Strain NY0313808BC1" /LENGTH=264 /DNA_ID=CAMNT_0050639699 /DNA_START=37 /DNA_END=831 /DNA_ORIENTATION=+
MQTSKQEHDLHPCSRCLVPNEEEAATIPTFRGEWDEEGVYVYQAYGHEIANWAIQHQRLGGPSWKPTRMTWIKPSFAWMLYRSGYGTKPGQTRVLKIKLSHATMADLLRNCTLSHGNVTGSPRKSKPNGNAVLLRGSGRVQWDPERDLFQSSTKGRCEPRRMLRKRAIQIGLAGGLSEFYVNQILSVEDVTNLAHQVKVIHGLKNDNDVATGMELLKPNLPVERPYIPLLSEPELRDLAMLPGKAADMVKQIGMGSGNKKNLIN